MSKGNNRRTAKLIADARRVIDALRRPGCSIWGCQIDTLIERLVREIERRERTP